MSITESDERLMAWNVGGMVETVIALMVFSWSLGLRAAMLNAKLQHC